MNYLSVRNNNVVRMLLYSGKEKNVFEEKLAKIQ